jgi:hypothetical protein
MMAGGEVNLYDAVAVITVNIARGLNYKQSVLIGPAVYLFVNLNPSPGPIDGIGAEFRLTQPSPRHLTW